MQIIRSENLHMKAYTVIKNSILEGLFRPGEKLKESKLAEKLGVSRGPVREAVKMLVQEGLLLQENHLCVYNPTFQDLVDLYQCREVMEAFAARLAALNITDHELDQLSKILLQTREATANNNIKEMVIVNTQFHDQIILASRNKELIRSLQMIRSKVMFIRNNGHKSYFREDHFINEHEAIFQMILKRDPLNAEKEMKQHIQKDVEKFEILFQKNPSFGTST